MSTQHDMGRGVDLHRDSPKKFGIQEVEEIEGKRGANLGTGVGPTSDSPKNFGTRKEEGGDRKKEGCRPSSLSQNP